MPVTTYVLIFILGWISGSVVNWLADVLPVERRFTAPECQACRKRLSVWNFLLIPWSCQHCGSGRGWRILGVQVAILAVAFWLWLVPPQRLDFASALLLMVYFSLVIVIDLEHRLILHPVSLVGAALGVWTGLRLHQPPVVTLIGGIAGFALMFGLYLFGTVFLKFYSRLKGQAVSNEDALGFGDVVFGGVLGFFLGWPGIFAGVALAILLGGAISLLVILIMLLRRRFHSFVAIPYGPFLVASAIILLFLKR